MDFITPEYWDTTPVFWVKPESKIAVSGNIESIIDQIIFAPHSDDQGIREINSQDLLSGIRLEYSYPPLRPSPGKRYYPSPVKRNFGIPEEYWALQFNELNTQKMANHSSLI